MSFMSSRYVVDDKLIAKRPALAVSAGETAAIMPNGAVPFASCYDRDRRRP